MPRSAAAVLTALASLSVEEFKLLPKSLRTVLSAEPTDKKGKLPEIVKKIAAAETTDDADKLRAEAADEDMGASGGKSVKSEAEDEDEAVGDKSKVYGVPGEDKHEPPRPVSGEAEAEDEAEAGAKAVKSLKRVKAALESEDEADAEADAGYEAEAEATDEDSAPAEAVPAWGQQLIDMLGKLLEVFQSPVASSDDGDDAHGADGKKKQGSEPVMKAQGQNSPTSIAAARRAVRVGRKNAGSSEAQTDALLLALKAREAQQTKAADADKAITWAQAQLKDRNVGDLDEFRETLSAHYASGGMPAVKRLVGTVKALVPALPGSDAHANGEAREDDEPELAQYAHDPKALVAAREVLKDWRDRPGEYRNQTLLSWLEAEPQLEGKARKTVRG